MGRLAGSEHFQASDHNYRTSITWTSICRCTGTHSVADDPNADIALLEAINEYNSFADDEIPSVLEAISPQGSKLDRYSPLNDADPNNSYCSVHSQFF